MSHSDWDRAGMSVVWPREGSGAREKSVSLITKNVHCRSYSLHLNLALGMAQGVGRCIPALEQAGSDRADMAAVEAAVEGRWLLGSLVAVVPRAAAVAPTLQLDTAAALAMFVADCNSGMAD